MADKKVAIVTASGQGIGAAVARELAADYRVALMSRSEAAVALARELGGIAVTGSVARADDLGRLVETTLREYGRIDAVVNNTGHAAVGELLDITDAEWGEGFELLFLNVVRMARLVTGQMVGQGGGSIVNISSYAAAQPTLSFPVSSAMRSGLAGFVKLYADRYSPEGVRMNNLLLGHIENHPRTEDALRQIPLGRPGALEEVAKTVRFLLSPEAGYITGQNIRADGGLARAL